MYCTASSAVKRGNLKGMKCIKSVSYTHLDVYKRQEDARDMGIRNWRRVAVDRVDWRRRLVEARDRLGL